MEANLIIKSALKVGGELSRKSDYNRSGVSCNELSWTIEYEGIHNSSGCFITACHYNGSHKCQCVRSVGVAGSNGARI